MQPLSSERRAEMDAECGDDDLNAFRFITVDAYLSAIPFYEKNDFRLFNSQLYIIVITTADDDNNNNNKLNDNKYEKKD